MVKRKLSLAEERDARIRLLKSLYELSNNDPNSYFNGRSIANNIPQTMEERFDVPYLINEWVERELAIEQINSDKTHTKQSTKWKADLSKSARIEEILNDYFSS